MLAADGTPLRPWARSPDAGETDGLERMYEDRLNGHPSAQLLFGERVIARTQRGARRPRADDDRPGADARGEIGARRQARRRRRHPPARRVRAARSPGSRCRRPSRPGRPSRSSPPRRRSTSGSRSPTPAIRCGRRRRCRASRCATRAARPAAARCTKSFIHSCNSVFAPLGAKVGARRLVGGARELRVRRAAADPGGQAEHHLAGRQLQRRPRRRRRGDRPGPRPRDAAGHGQRGGDDRDAAAAAPGRASRRCERVRRRRVVSARAAHTCET